MTTGYSPLDAICEHGNAGSQRKSRNPVHAWTRVWWPAALFAALALFFVPYYAGMSWTEWGLLEGSILLGVPELSCFVTGNPQDTLSDWVWNTWHITGTQPINQWNAGHWLGLCGWIFIATNVTVYLATVAWQAALGSSLFLGAWLIMHFWGRWFA